MAQKDPDLVSLNSHECCIVADQSWRSARQRLMQRALQRSSSPTSRQQCWSCHIRCLAMLLPLELYFFARLAKFIMGSVTYEHVIRSAVAEPLRGSDSNQGDYGAHPATCHLHPFYHASLAFGDCKALQALQCKMRHDSSDCHLHVPQLCAWHRVSPNACSSIR